MIEKQKTAMSEGSHNPGDSAEFSNSNTNPEIQIPKLGRIGRNHLQHNGVNVRASLRGHIRSEHSSGGKSNNERSSIINLVRDTATFMRERAADLSISGSEPGKILTPSIEPATTTPIQRPDSPLLSSDLSPAERLAELEARGATVGPGTRPTGDESLANIILSNERAARTGKTDEIIDPFSKPDIKVLNEQSAESILPPGGGAPALPIDENIPFNFDDVLLARQFGKYKVVEAHNWGKRRIMYLEDPDTKQRFSTTDSKNPEMMASIAEEVPDGKDIYAFEKYIEQQIRDQEDLGQSLKIEGIDPKWRTLVAYELAPIAGGPPMTEEEQRARKNEKIEEFKNRLFLAAAQQMAATGNKDNFIAIVSTYIGKSGFEQLMFKLENKEPEKFQISQAVKLFEIAKIVPGPPPLGYAVDLTGTEKTGDYFRVSNAEHRGAIERAIKARLTTQLITERDDAINWVTKLSTSPEGIAAAAAVAAGGATPEQQALVDKVNAGTAVAAGVATPAQIALVSGETTRAAQASLWPGNNPDTNPELAYRANTSLMIGQRLIEVTGMGSFYGGATEEIADPATGLTASGNKPRLLKQIAIERAIAAGIPGFTPGKVNLNRPEFWQIMTEVREEFGVNELPTQIYGETTAYSNQGMFANVFNMPETIKNSLLPPYADSILPHLDSRVENFAAFMGYANLSDMMETAAVGGLNAGGGKITDKMGRGTASTWSRSLKGPDEFMGAAMQFLKNPLEEPDTIRDNVEKSAVINVMKPLLELTQKTNYMQNLYLPQTRDDLMLSRFAEQRFKEDMVEATMLFHAKDGYDRFKWRKWNSNTLSAFIKRAGDPKIGLVRSGIVQTEMFEDLGGSHLLSAIWNAWAEGREGLKEGWKVSRRLALRIAIEAFGEELANSGVGK